MIMTILPRRIKNENKKIADDDKNKRKFLKKKNSRAIFVVRKSV